MHPSVHLAAARKAIELRESLLPAVSPAEECNYCGNPECTKSYREHIEQELQALKALEAMLQGSVERLWQIVSKKYSLDMIEILEMNIAIMNTMWQQMEMEPEAFVADSDVGVVRYILFMVSHAYRSDYHFPGMAMTEDQKNQVATQQIHLQRWLISQILELLMDKMSEMSPGRPSPRNGWGQYN